MGIQRRTLPEIRVVTLAQKLSTRIISAGLVPSSMCMPSSNRDATLAFAVCSLASARPMGFRGSSLGLALLYPETSSAASPLDPGWMAKLLSREIGGTIRVCFCFTKTSGRGASPGPPHDIRAPQGGRPALDRGPARGSRRRTEARGRGAHWPTRTPTAPSGSSSRCARPAAAVAARNPTPSGRLPLRGVTGGTAPRQPLQGTRDSVATEGKLALRPNRRPTTPSAACPGTIVGRRRGGWRSTPARAPANPFNGPREAPCPRASVLGTPRGYQPDHLPLLE